MSSREATNRRGAPRPVEARGTFVIRVFERGRAPQEVRFHGHALSVGCDPSCDLWLESPGIALHHLEVRPAAGTGFVAMDLGSPEGTHVAGHRLNRGEEYSLREGERVRVGEIDLEFERVLDVEVTELEERASSRPEPELAWASWNAGADRKAAATEGERRGSGGALRSFRYIPAATEEPRFRPPTVGQLVQGVGLLVVLAAAAMVVALALL